MRKLCKRVGFCLLLVALVWCGTAIADRQRLREELIRLHVVAASDSQEDQALKLQVRDAVLESLSRELENVTDREQAFVWLRENLEKIQQIAVSVLEAAGCEDTVSVTMTEEAFDTRSYAGFSLPAGIYNALRITIGQGQGENGWCVIFPSFCTTEDFEEAAKEAGFPESLAEALTGQVGSRLRFFILDLLGKLENLVQGG